MPLRRYPEDGNNRALARGTACHRCFSRKVRCTGQPEPSTGLNACAACLRTARFKGHSAEHCRCAFGVGVPTGKEGLCSEEGGPNLVGEIYPDAGPARKREARAPPSTSKHVLSPFTQASPLAPAKLPQRPPPLAVPARSANSASSTDTSNSADTQLSNSSCSSIVSISPTAATLAAALGQSPTDMGSTAARDLSSKAFNLPPSQLPPSLPMLHAAPPPPQAPEAQRPPTLSLSTTSASMAPRHPSPHYTSPAQLDTATTPLLARRGNQVPLSLALPATSAAPVPRAAPANRTWFSQPAPPLQPPPQALHAAPAQTPFDPGPSWSVPGQSSMAPPPATQHPHQNGGLQQVANGVVSAAQYPSYTAAEIPQGQYAFPPPTQPQSQPQSQSQPQPQSQQELPSRSGSESSFSTAPPSATFAPSAAVDSASEYLYAMQQDGPRLALPSHPDSRPHTGDGSAFGSQQKQQPQQQQQLQQSPLSMSMPSAYGALSDFAVQAPAYSHGSAPDSFVQFEPSPQMLLTPGGSLPGQADAAQHVKTEYGPWMGSFHLPSPGLTFSSRSPQWFAQAGQTSYFQA